MIKYKLTPIDPRDIDARLHNECAIYQGEIYEAMTAECPTVKLVDVYDLKQVISNAVYNYEQVANRKTSIHEYIHTSIDDYLTQNGYKIIKECE